MFVFIFHNGRKRKRGHERKKKTERNGEEKTT